MHSHITKPNENKTSAASGNGIKQQNNNSKPIFQFTDNRLETIAQRKLQESVANSSQIKKQNSMQTIADNHQTATGKAVPIQKKNNTGLPDNLKVGVENLSGYSMDDVKVHYNSDKPKQLKAHAYAQGINIHIAPGQEKHLPHEAWHVVQQKQGRVYPIVQLKDYRINNDESLEEEADKMGTVANGFKGETTFFKPNSFLTPFSPIQLFKIKQGGGLIWDTDWPPERKAARILSQDEKNKEIIKRELQAFLSPENKEREEEGSNAQKEISDARDDLEHIDNLEWAKEANKQKLEESNTGGSFPQEKGPGSGTRTIHVNYVKPNVNSTSPMEMGHLRFFIEQAVNLGLKIIITTTGNANDEITAILKSFKCNNYQIVNTPAGVSRWAEDNTEFLQNGKMASLTTMKTDLGRSMKEGREARWQRISGIKETRKEAEQTTPKKKETRKERERRISEKDKKTINELSDKIEYGTKVNDTNEARLIKETATEVTGSDAVNIRAYIEGGNFIPGKDKAGKKMVLVGKDSIYATMAAYNISQNATIEIIKEDFGLETPTQVILVEQPGRFHLDMGLLLVGNGTVIVNNSYEAYIWGGGKMPIPKFILKRNALEQQAVEDLRVGGMDVVRKPFATDEFNFLNGEFVQGPDGKDYFLTNGGLNPEQEQQVREYYVNELKIVADVKFSPREAAKETLSQQGGAGCRIKGSKL